MASTAHASHCRITWLGRALIALQSGYSLIERTLERNLIPMAKKMGLVVIPWSPLANGVLSGTAASI